MDVSYGAGMMSPSKEGYKINKETCKQTFLQRQVCHEIVENNHLQVEKTWRTGTPNCYFLRVYQNLGPLIHGLNLLVICIFVDPWNWSYRKTGWWQLKCFLMFSPKIREMIQFDYSIIIFWWGWIPQTSIYSSNWFWSTNPARCYLMCRLWPLLDVGLRKLDLCLSVDWCHDPCNKVSGHIDL